MSRCVRKTMFNLSCVPIKSSRSSKKESHHCPRSTCSANTFLQRLQKAKSDRPFDRRKGSDEIVHRPSQARNNYMWRGDSHPSASTVKVYLLNCRLTLSGVGPKAHLSEVGKHCIHDLPGVGSTLVFHKRFSLTLLARSCLRSNNILRPLP